MHVCSCIIIIYIVHLKATHRMYVCVHSFKSFSTTLLTIYVVSSIVHSLIKVCFFHSMQLLYDPVTGASE